MNTSILDDQPYDHKAYLATLISINPNFKLLDKHLSTIVSRYKYTVSIVSDTYIELKKTKLIHPVTLKQAQEFAERYNIVDKKKIENISIIITLLENLSELYYGTFLTGRHPNNLSKKEFKIEQEKFKESDEMENERRIMKEILFHQKYEVLEITFKVKNLKNEKIQIKRFKAPLTLELILDDLKYKREYNPTGGFIITHNEWDYDESPVSMKKQFYFDRKQFTKACKNILVEDNKLVIPEGQLITDEVCEMLYDLLELGYLIKPKTINSTPAQYIHKLLK